MFPLLQLQLASNILRSDSNDEIADYRVNKNIDPSVFSIENYSAVLPMELSGKGSETCLRKLPVSKTDSEITITDVPKGLRQIRIFSKSSGILPLQPGQLGIIEEGSRNKRAYFLAPASELNNVNRLNSQN